MKIENNIHDIKTAIRRRIESMKALKVEELNANIRRKNKISKYMTTTIDREIHDSDRNITW